MGQFGRRPFKPKTAVRVARSAPGGRPRLSSRRNDLLARPATAAAGANDTAPASRCSQLGAGEVDSVRPPRVVKCLDDRIALLVVDDRDTGARPFEGCEGDVAVR